MGVHRGRDSDLRHASARAQAPLPSLYERVARRKGHPTAIGAVVRHLAEVTYWLLSKQEPYREPRSAAISSNGG
jgi:hypothetical protein